MAIVKVKAKTKYGHCKSKNKNKNKIWLGFDTFSIFFSKFSQFHFISLRFYFFVPHQTQSQMARIQSPSQYFIYPRKFPHLLF